MTELPLTFPILALVPNYGVWGIGGVEMVECYQRETDFTEVSTYDLKKRPHTEMLIVDATGQCWRVLAIERVGIAGTGFRKFVNMITRDEHLVHYEMEKCDALPFEEIRRRVCESIQSHPESYRDDEALAGESAPPREEQEMLDELTDKARAASNIPELVDVFLVWLIARDNGDV